MPANSAITIDYTRDTLFDELGIKRLKESYMTSEETSPQDRFAFVSQQFSSNPEHAQRLYDYASKHWLSYSTPILSFAGRKRQLPISCYLPYLADTAEGLVDTLSEVNWLSMLGGGVGLGIGIRATDDKSVGIMPHLRTYDASCLAYRQGQTRRGSYATYLDISHPDILMFLEMRKPTGDPNMRCQNLHHGINIPDAFMEIIERCMLDPSADDSWALKDPHSDEVRETISAKDLWQRILETRMQTGEPYLHFIDTSNKHLPEYQKKLGLKIRQSNLCLTGDMQIHASSDPLGKDYDTIRLDDLVEKWHSGYYNECYVRSMEYGQEIWILVLNAGRTGNVEELIEIETPSGNTLRCTGNHQVYTKNSGWVDAKDLTETDVLVELVEYIEPQKDQRTGLKIRSLTVPPTPVYDLTVNGTPSIPAFFANKILVHNCSEIILPTDKERTAVCCLSSVNLKYYDDWKNDPIFLSDVAEMLDNVLQYFIDHAPKEIKRAKYSAARERSIGIGALGFHAYLQKKRIPWESAPATSINKKIFKHIREELNAANLRLGKERGEAPDAVGTGLRFSHLMAVAPNATSSTIMGNTSPSVEPFRANAYRQDTLSGTYLNKNPYLDVIIKKACNENTKLNYDDVWSSIIANDGSVQHLEFLDEYMKSVFKTAMEIDQRWVVQHATDRQEFVDQAQSINLFFRPDANIKYLHAVHFQAWKSGLKTLYYCRSEKLMKADKVAKRIERKVIEEIDLKALATGEDTCLACEG